MEKLSNKLVSKLVYIVSFLSGVIAFAQPPARPGAVVNPGGGAGAVGPGGTGGEPTVPVDMYEGALLMVAVLMMVGYYLYTRNRKAIA